MYTDEEVLILLEFAKVLTRRKSDKNISLLKYSDDAYCLIKIDGKWTILNNSKYIPCENIIDALCKLINYAYIFDHSAVYQEFDFMVKLENAELVDKTYAQEKRLSIYNYLSRH